MSGSTDRTHSSPSRSGATSPLHSPSHGSSQRKSAPGPHFVGAGFGTTPGSKPLNPSWQVWGAAPATAQESSATSRSDLTQQGAAYTGESWRTPRTTNAQWEEPGSHMQRAGPYPSVALQPGRQRPGNGPSVAALMTPPGPVPRAGRYNRSVGREAIGATTYPASSPTKPVTFRAGSPFGAQPQVHASSGMIGPYDSVSSAAADETLSSALRGMVVEDEYGLTQHPNPRQSSQPHPPNSAEQSRSAVSQARGHQHSQQPVAPFGTFPQPDFGSYYNTPSRVDFPYPFDAYRAQDPMFGSPALSPANPATLIYPGMSNRGHQRMGDLPSPHVGVFYDYSAANRPASHYYYPQVMPFQHVGPPPAHPGGSPVFKKQAGPPSPQHPRLSPQTSMYGNLRSPMLSHQGFLPVDYQAQMPIAHPMYGHREVGPALYMQQYGGRGRRVPEDPAGVYRSPLLEEFRNDRLRAWELKDLYGHIVEFSMDQHGSRFIQQRLETATEEERQIIFDEIMPQHALLLIQDVFGNYVLQKFLEYGTATQKAVLVDCMQGHILPLALQMYGCRVVQKAVETVSPEQQSVIIRELEENVLRCVKDANGNHVIQRLIEKVDPERLTFIRFFVGYVQDLATHPYGCRVLQRCFEHLPDTYTRPLLEELQRHAIRLMQDQFGNYVIQFVLESGTEQDRMAIITQIRGRILQMSRHKFASNVCEKALITADSENRAQMIEEMMRVRQDGSSPVVSMMKDQYANYVLQRAISVATVEQRTALIEKMKPHLTILRKRAGQSRHLVAIERLIAKCTTAETQNEIPLEEHSDVHATDSTTSETS